MTQLVILLDVVTPSIQWACDRGKGVELIGNFLNCAFVKGVNTNNNRGLKKVVEDTGLDWLEAKKLVGQTGWEDALESNRQVMYVVFGVYPVLDC